MLNATPLMLVVLGAAASGAVELVHVAAASICGTISALLTVVALVQFLGRCELQDVSTVVWRMVNPQRTLIHGMHGLT